jgi:hypothetical protein
MASSVYWSMGKGGYFPRSKAARAWGWPFNLHLLPRLRMCGAIPLHLHLASWHVQGYFCLYFVNDVYCTHVTHSMSSIDELQTSPTVRLSVLFLNNHLGFLNSTDFQKATFRSTHIGGRLFTFFNIQFYFAFHITDCVSSVEIRWLRICLYELKQTTKHSNPFRLTVQYVYSCWMITYIIFIFSYFNYLVSL